MLDTKVSRAELERHTVAEQDHHCWPATAHCWSGICGVPQYAGSKLMVLRFPAEQPASLHGSEVQQPTNFAPFPQA